MTNYLRVVIGFLAICFTVTTGSAQTCPDQLGNQSSTTRIHFKITSGTCNDFATTIEIEGRTFTKGNCNGTNLFYDLDGGQTPISNAGTFLANLVDILCEYTDGVLTGGTLGLEDGASGPSFSMLMTSSRVLKLQFQQALTGKVNLIDITGRLQATYAFEEQLDVEIDGASLSRGIYLVRVEADNRVSTKKLLVQ